LGALQQFFEALGLTSPPRVHANDLFIMFFGKPGETHYYTLQLTTLENRPLYSFATSELPWLKAVKVTGLGKVVGSKLAQPLPRPPAPFASHRPGDSAAGPARAATARGVPLATADRSGRDPSRPARHAAARRAAARPAERPRAGGAETAETGRLRAGGGAAL